MSLTPQRIQAAEAIQHAAAHDASPQVRIVAGPGTGKSRAIEERIRWLLASGAVPQGIYVVSFTRAASRDLQQRIEKHCIQNGQPGVAMVHVSTLHSLALRLLRAGGLLAAFPVGPFILDDWESENIIDAEFSHVSGKSPGRCAEIRRYHEAFWSTGQWGPPNYIPPNPPIDAAETTSFGAFHGPRTQTYCCVLPGELVRRCAQATAAGLLDPAALLGIQHLVVDEFQDLNQSDLDFVEALIARGVVVFICGDDDQRYTHSVTQLLPASNCSLSYTLVPQTMRYPTVFGALNKLFSAQTPLLLNLRCQTEFRKHLFPYMPTLIHKSPVFCAAGTFIATGTRGRPSRSLAAI